MKKTVISIVSALLGCSLAFAQGADVTFIGRLEQNPLCESGEWSSYWGNSSLYGFIDGSITENLSYYAAAHFLGEDVPGLYEAIGKNEPSALLNAYLTYETGIFSFSLGKTGSVIGCLENDEDDVMLHYPLASVTWNYANTYLWGGIIGIQPWESTGFELSVTSSPFVEKIFDGMQYSLKWSGEYGPVSTLWSIHRADLGESSHLYYAALGTAVDFADSRIFVDSYVFDDYQESTLGYLQSIGEKFETIVTAGFTHEADKFHFRAGAGLHWYPLKDDALRVHAICGYNKLYESTEFSFGATYTLGFHLGR